MGCTTLTAHLQLTSIDETTKHGFRLLGPESAQFSDLSPSDAAVLLDVGHHHAILLNRVGVLKPYILAGLSDPVEGRSEVIPSVAPRSASLHHPCFAELGELHSNSRLRFAQPFGEFEDRLRTCRFEFMNHSEL